MKKEYDFSKGVRGKFYRPDAELNIPVYLEPKVARAVRERARQRRTTMATVVNQVLRKNLRAGRQKRSSRARASAA